MSEDVEKVLSILFTTGQKAVIEASNSFTDKLIMWLWRNFWRLFTRS